MDYKQTNIAGTSWVRCNTVTITNPLQGFGEIDPKTFLERGPAARFQEELAMSLPGGQMLLQDVGSCRAEFSAGGSFPLLNPETGEALGVTMSHQELYVALFSLYMATATARDAQG